jgi:hypothetical protein
VHGSGPEAEPNVASNLSRFRRWSKHWAARLRGDPVARKRSQIDVATDRVMVIRRARITRCWCADCGSVVDFVGLVEAHAIAGFPAPILPGSVLAQGCHVVEIEDGQVLICLESLLKSRSCGGPQT